MIIERIPESIAKPKANYGYKDIFLMTIHVTFMHTHVEIKLVRTVVGNNYCASIQANKII